MLWYKVCPRCKVGDMNLDEDNARHCLQCGYRQYTTVAAMEPETAKLFDLDETLLQAVRAERELVPA